MGKEEFEKLVKESFSINDLSLKIYGYSSNQSTRKKISNLIEQYKSDISHFGMGKKNTKYKRETKICPICESEFITIVDHRDEKYTCSRSCTNKYFHHGINNPNFNKDKYKDRYIKVSKSLEGKINKSPIIRPKCKKCDNLVKRKNRIYCSNKCRSLDPLSEEAKLKISEKAKFNMSIGRIKPWSSRNIESYPEKFFKKVLEVNGIEYEFNKLISKRDLGVDEVGNYFLDFFIPEKNIDLEIDGNQHNYRKDHDELRDSRISKFYRVYRIEWRNINIQSGKDYIRNEINKFLEFYKSI